MKKILAILMLLMLNLNIALAQNLESDETNLSEKDIQYLSAWTSLAVYNDKFSLLARDILKSNGWNIRFYNEQIAKSDVKYLLADKKINDKDKIAQSLRNKGIIQTNLGNYDTAIEL